MKMRWLPLAFALMAVAAVALEDIGDTSEDGVTVITSDKLTFDYNKHFAFFDGHVVVTDPEMKLTADQMTVHFTKENQVETIMAEGSVVIIQEDKTANSEKATYEVATGQIKLEINPRVRRGKDMLQGEVITFWRDENKMICEPQARLVIFPEKGGARDQLLFGE